MEVIVMKKTLISLFVCLFLILGFSSTASACSIDTGNISVYSNNNGTVIFNTTVKNGEGLAWIEFGDSVGGISLGSGSAKIQHDYAKNGYYIITMYMNNVPVSQTKVTIKGKNNYNQLSLVTNDFNQLKINVNYSGKTTLYWGDGTNVTLKGNNSSVSHDYAYKENIINEPITLTLGTGYNTTTATFVIDAISKTSTFTTGSSEITKIISYSTLPCTNILIPTNDWAVGNYVILTLNTKIYNTGYSWHKIIKSVSNSYWLAQVISGPISINNHRWWEIKLADGTKGWIQQDLADPIENLFN